MKNVSGYSIGKIAMYPITRKGAYSVSGRKNDQNRQCISQDSLGTHRTGVYIWHSYMT